MTPDANAPRERGARSKAWEHTTDTRRDVFRQARESLTVFDVWPMLNLPGEPKKGCRSPFRDDPDPSFSIFDDGKHWKDHGTGGLGGDLIDFVAVALGGDKKAAWRWFADKLGIDTGPHRNGTRLLNTTRPPAPAARPEQPRRIEWPGELIEGTAATWAALAKRRQLSFPAVWSAVHGGLLRFLVADGAKCYTLTDDTRRAAEIRRCDGRTFPNGRKAFPLAGVDKSWLPGLDLLRDASAETGVFVCEGASDLLAAVSLYTSYRKAGGVESWVPAACLGASCRRLHPEGAALIRGRWVRLCFDGDNAGRAGADHWGETLSPLSCRVERIELPEGRDLRDMAEAGELRPEELFQ